MEPRDGVGPSSPAYKAGALPRALDEAEKPSPTACWSTDGHSLAGALQTRALPRFIGFVTGPPLAGRRPAGIRRCCVLAFGCPGASPGDHPEAAATHLPGQAGNDPLRDAGGVATTDRDASTAEPPILPAGCPVGFQVVANYQFAADRPSPAPKSADAPEPRPALPPWREDSRPKPDRQLGTSPNALVDPQTCHRDRADRCRRPGAALPYAPEGAAGRWARPAFGERGTSLGGPCSGNRTRMAGVEGRSLAIRPCTEGGARQGALHSRKEIMTVGTVETPAAEAAGAEAEAGAARAQVFAAELLEQLFSSPGPPAGRV